MAGVLLNQGEVVMLEALVNKGAPETLELRLFQNDVVPVETHVETNYTEATFTGYSAMALTPGSWVTSGTAPTQTAYPEQTFTSSADQTLQRIYGYYLTQTTSGKAVWAERFTNGPYAIQLNTAAIKVTVVVTQD